MRSNDTPADSLLTFGCGAIIVLAVVLVCAGIIGPKGCMRGGPAERSPTIGDDAVLRSTSTDQVPIARTQKDLDRLSELSFADDTTGISQMLLAGRIWVVPSGTKCKVIKSGFMTYEVRLMGGAHAGESGFVIREVVKRQ